MEYIKFENFIDSTQYGYTADTTSLVSGDAKYLRITDIVPYFVDKDRVPFCAIDASKVDKYLVHDGDVLIARTGATTGYNLVVDDSFNNYVFASYLIRFNYNRKKLYPRYLKYVLKSPSWYGFVNNYIGGSAQPGMNARVFGKYYLPYTDLYTQQRIATILSTYDSLIENNQKRIKILEQMAENLYKEWFVRFRFPGYEAAEFEDGVPKGWEKKALGNYVEIKRGGSPRPIQDYLAEKGLRWLKISDATSTQGAYIFEIRERILESGLSKTVFLEAGSLVLSNSATPGIPKILAVDSCIHDGWLYFQNSSFSNEFLFLLFNHERPNIAKLGNGAVFTNLKTDIVKGYQIVVPPTAIRNTFQSLIEPLFIEMKTLQKGELNLTHQRDLLLPRLMSGKLSI